MYEPSLLGETIRLNLLSMADLLNWGSGNSVGLSTFWGTGAVAAATAAGGSFTLGSGSAGAGGGVGPWSLGVGT